MAQFSDIYNNVADQFGNTSTAMITRIKRYINFTQQDIASRANFEFLMKKSFFQCTVPYTTGTVYASGTTLTGVDTTFTSAMVGRKIRIGGESEYYTISAFTSTTVLTLDQSYIGTYDTLAEATTYSIYQDIYSLTSDADKIITLTNPSQSYKLKHVARQEYDAVEPNPLSTGTPEIWIPAGRDSNNYIQVQLHLIPDDNYVIYFWYRKRLSDLSADTDISLIPIKYHKLLYLGAVAQAYEWDGDNQANNYWAQYENMIGDMINDLESGAEDAVPVLRSIDEGVGTSRLRLPPEHFSD